MACEGSPHVFHYSAVEDQYWYRDDQQWYICESQPCPHRHLSFDWTQEEWAGFPAYRKTHPNQSQLIEARLNQPPPTPVARPPRPAVVASRSLLLRTHSKQAYWTYTFLSFLRHPRIHQMGTMTTEHSPQLVTCNTARSPQYTAHSP